MRKMGFHFGLVFVFLRFSLVHESFALLTGLNLNIALLAGGFAIALLLAANGIPRALQGRPARFWLAFLVFFALSVPFSSWRSESLTMLISYLRGDFPLLFILGGMALTWKECRTVLACLAASGIIVILSENMFGHIEQSGRMTMGGGTIGNSNDYAAHLLLLLPFILWVVLTPSAWILKAIGIVFSVYGVYVDLKTGSRGALVALIAGCVLILLKGPGKVRWILGLGAPIVLTLLLGALSQSMMDRYSSILGSKGKTTVGEGAGGATSSSEAREYLLTTSLEISLHYPIFGIGAGDFSSYEGGTSFARRGIRGQWQETHNSYTQISSELGIPAAICYIGAIWTTFTVLWRIMKTARRNQLPAFVSAAFCIALALATICTAMFFLSLGYRFYLPALSGLTIAIERAMNMEFLSPFAASSGAPESSAGQPFIRYTPS